MHIFYLLVFFITLCWHGAAFGGMDSLIARANDAGLPLSDRIDMLEKNLQRSDSRADLCHALGRLWMSKNTPASRLRADHYLYRAIVLAPDSVSYRLDYAILQRKRGFRYNAMKHFEKALAMDSSSAAAACGIGDYHLRDMLKYIDARRFDGEGSMRDFAMESVDLAARHYRHAVDCDPYFRRGYFGLGMLSYEGGFYEDLVLIADDLLRRWPDDPDGLLLLGLGHYALGAFEASGKAFRRAISQMDSTGRAVMSDLSLFGRAGDIDFWKDRDPLLLTAVNERELAHWGRVAYANMRFGLPDEGVPGWETDMGRAWIRYGRYVRRDCMIPSEEIWEYEDFALRFKSFDAIHWRLELLRDDRWALNSVGGFGRGEVFGEAFDLVERYVDPYVDRKYVLPHQVGVFKGAHGKIRLALSWAVPKAHLAYYKLYNTYQVDVRSGVFLRSAGSDSVWQYRWRRTAFEEVWFDSLKARYLLDERVVEVDPDSIYLSVETQDLERSSIGVLRDTLRVSAFDSARVALSSALLASSVAEREDGTLAVAPNPLRAFAPGELLYVYFEVYNLSRDAFGQTDFSVSYQIGPPRLRRLAGKIDRNILKKLNVDSDMWRISVRTDYLGRKSDEQLYLAVDLSELKPGLHLLALVLTDNRTGLQAWREALFVISE